MACVGGCRVVSGLRFPRFGVGLGVFLLACVASVYLWFVLVLLYLDCGFCGWFRLLAVYVLFGVGELRLGGWYDGLGFSGWCGWFDYFWWFWVVGSCCLIWLFGVLSVVLVGSFLVRVELGGG